MSYCVNCGVRLGDAERKCPLCGVQVINPVRPYDPDAPHPHPLPDGSAMPRTRFDRRTIAFVISCALALPGLLCVAVDLIYGNPLDWSLYVVGAVVTVWVFFALPLLHTRVEARERGLLPILIPDAVALLTYLWVIERLASPDEWFVLLALPIAGTFCLLVIVMGLLIERRKLRGLYALVGILLSIAVLVVVIEIATELNIDRSVRITWSLFAVIPAVVLSGILLFLGRSRAFREDVSRKLHF